MFLNKNIKVTVVVTVFNKVNDVGACLESVIAQDYRNCELIIVDDGSDDGSDKVINNYKNKYPSIIYIRQSNSGLSAARNTGLDKANGEFVLFHDGDDTLFSDAVSRLLEIAVKHHSDIVGGVFNRVNGNSAELVRAFYEDRFNIDFANENELAQRYSTNFSSCNKLFRVKFLKDNKLRFTPGLYMQDIEFWLKCMYLTKRISQTKIVVGNYVNQPESSSKLRSEGRMSSLFVLFDNLNTFFSSRDLEDYKVVMNHALMQGAVMFFAKWYLDCDGDGSGKTLDEFRALLNRIPDKDYLSFMNRKRASPVSYLLLMIRENKMELANHLYTNFESVSRRIRQKSVHWDTKKSVVSGLKDIVIKNNKGKYKVVIFTSGNLHNIGGVQRSYYFLTSHLVRSGHDVTVIGWGSGSERDSLAYPLDSRVRIILVKQKMSSQNFIEVVGLLNKISPDVAVIVNSTRYSVFLAAACIEAKVQYVQSIRGSSEYCLKYLWPDVNFLRAVYMCASAGHVLMESYKDIFPSSLRAKIEAIPSQIQPAEKLVDPRLKNKNNRFIVLYSGRFSFEKRVHLLIEAFSKLKDKFNEWDLWLYGTGPMEQELIGLCVKYGFGNRVTIGNAKNTDEMYRVYPEVHIKVLPSEQEGCPMALREAMSHGIPVIAYTECSGANEIVKNGVNGILMDNSLDHVSQLVVALDKLMDAGDLRYEYGAQARKTADEYTPDSINIKWEKLIVNAINSVGRSDGFVKYYESAEYRYAKSMIQGVVKNERFMRFVTFNSPKELYEKHKYSYLLIYGHRFFDYEYYLYKYIEVKKDGLDPLLHYLEIGWVSGYDPSPEFSSYHYTKDFNLADNICPLVHFYALGRFSGYVPKPTDDCAQYYERWPNKIVPKPYTFDNDSKNERQYFNKLLSEKSLLIQ